MNNRDFTKQVAQLIESQFPEMYREDGQELVAFVSAYYEFLESDDEYSYKIGRQMMEIHDIDESLDRFIKHFKETYLTEFPFVFSTDKRFTIKHITDYYRSKGSKQSLELLMRLLFNEQVDIYYPSTDVFKPSDSQWSKPYYLEVTRSKRNRKFINNEVTGVRSGAHAIVESVVSKRVNGKVFDVLYLSSVRGNFRTGERITDSTGEVEDAPIVKGSLTSLELILGGRDNAVGDIFNVITDEGVQGKVKVSGVRPATGRVDFAIVDGGWGFTTDSTTEVAVSEAIMFANNQNTSFFLGETVKQPLEKVYIYNGTNVLSANVGSYLVGKNGSTVVANGVIVAVANTFANGVPTANASTYGVITVQTSSGTFMPQKLITLSGPGIVQGEYVSEETQYDMTYSNLIGTISVGDSVTQTITETYGAVVTGITGTLVANSRIVEVDSVDNLIPGQPLVKTSGTGAFTSGTRIKSIANTTHITITKDPATAGSILFSANTYTAVTGSASGIVTASNASIISVTGWGPFSSGALITDANTAGSALVTGVSVSNTNVGARGKVTAVSANTITVDVLYGEFDNSNRLRGDSSKVIRTINSSADSGAVDVYVNGLSAANASISSIEDIKAEGKIAGQNTSAFGIYGNTMPFFVANTFTPYIYTDRASTFVSPPRYANGVIVEVSMAIDRLAGGAGADFIIGGIENTDENVTLLTDIVGDRNVYGRPFTNNSISGAGSGIGFVATINIINGGTGYSDGDRIAFAGGGFANGAPDVYANAVITANSSGGITSILVDQPGEGYFQDPVLVLPLGGSGANLSVEMLYGYGFPKNPLVGYNNLIGDALNYAVADIGSISLLSRINPGSGYTADPFVLVRNKYVAGYKRRDMVLTVSGGSTFVIGDEITQTIASVTSSKGFVTDIVTLGGTTLLYVERHRLNISFDIGSPVYGTVSRSTATLLAVAENETKRVAGFNADISATAISAVGIATGLEVVSSGFGYIDGDEVTLESVDGDNPFIITAVTRTGRQGISEGYWKTTTSHLNSEKKIHDNKYYQEYSYDVISGMSLNRYEDILKKVFHVAGTRMFGSVVKTARINSNVKVASSSITSFNS